LNAAAVFGTGLFLSASLLVAIGAQNAFVLRQGLRREHVLAIASACSAFDWLLMAAGVGGLGAVVHDNPGMARWFGACGALFLFGYGVLAWRKALTAQSLMTCAVTLKVAVFVAAEAVHAVKPNTANASSFPHDSRNMVIIPIGTNDESLA